MHLFIHGLDVFLRFDTSSMLASPQRKTETYLMAFHTFTGALINEGVVWGGGGSQVVFPLHSLCLSWQMFHLGSALSTAAQSCIYSI